MPNKKPIKVLLKYVNTQDLRYINSIYISKKKRFFQCSFFNSSLLYSYSLNVLYTDGLLTKAKLPYNDKEILKPELLKFNIFFNNNLSNADDDSSFLGRLQDTLNTKKNMVRSRAENKKKVINA